MCFAHLTTILQNADALLAGGHMDAGVFSDTLSLTEIEFPLTAFVPTLPGSNRIPPELRLFVEPAAPKEDAFPPPSEFTLEGSIDVAVGASKLFVQC